jgi:sec-independent protein translocase protein TatC
MSERDFPSDNPAPNGTHHGSTFDDSPPQPIPRAGLGIADRIGFPAIERDESTPVSTFADNARDNGCDEGESSNSLDADDDPALIPELAPLAATTPLAARAVEPAALDEFDVEATRQASAQYSNSVQEYSGGGGGGNDDGRDSFGEDDDFGGAPQDLFSHLAELRVRILYSVLAIAVASTITWHYGKWIQEFLAKPILKTLKASGLRGAQLITIEPTEGFYLYFQITLSAAILLAAPFILFQIWRFIEPALTRTERRYTIFLVPFSVILFFSGVVLGYVLSPLFFSFFLQFQPPEAVATFSYGKSVALLAKMLLVFGVCFQVPVVTIFLNKVGILSRNFLIEYWRHAVIVIFTIVAVITPTWDPLTLCACATPPCLLYVLSIWLVKWL